MLSRKLELTLLGLVLAVGVALRFYGFPDIPFWHDELSAWVRTGYTSFSRLIYEGVIPDGHPALIQVFLNYYRFAFGDDEAVFKFPFLLMGTASVYLTYLIGRQWFSVSTGLLSAAVLAVTQLAVMQSQVARPYASGLFFTLLMAWSWWQYLQAANKRQARRYGLMVFGAGVLCAYNHYFSLLQAALLCGCGWFLLPADRRKAYTLVCLFLAVLFVPHVPITLKHVQQGGIGGWLAAPKPDFALSYLGYITHFSGLFQGATALILLINTAANFRFIKKNRMRLVTLFLALMPGLIGYAYSVLRNPVLHYWVLLFSLPFLLLWAFSFCSDDRPLLTASGVLLLLVVGSSSLIYERRHYEVFYRQPTEQAVRLTKVVLQQTQDPVTVLLNHPPRHLEYYLRREHPRPSVVLWHDLRHLTQSEFRLWLRQQHSALMACSNLPYEQLLVVRELYPYLQWRRAGLNHDWYVFRRQGPATLPLVYFSDSLFKRREIESHASARDTSMWLDSTMEFSAGMHYLIDSIAHHHDDWLVAGVRFSELEPNSEAYLVVTLWASGKQQYWSGRRLDEGAVEGSGRVYVALRLRDYPLEGQERQIRVYVWNKKRDAFRLDQLWVQLDAGNPWLYASVEPIPPYAEEYRAFLNLP
ncbi:MAG: glycosyltransferase family 39 protein [Chitinophagales bacterium]|nr:glycosyltransferase family 39 protein [Chitinophagales bacterium]MDW8427903.1 glycosyltransferase family 39 protein [Chitinophagales bacterium]